MSEQEAHQTHSRSAAKGRFLTKLNRYRRLVLGKWWVLLVGAVLGGGAGFAIRYFGPPSFESFGRMMVGVKLSIPENSVYTEELSNFLGTQAALMQSDVVLNRALQRIEGRFPGQLDPKQMSLKVTVLPRTTIFLLRATGPNPGAIQAFLQASMEEYTNLKKEMRNQTSDNTVAELMESLLQLQKAVTNADNAIVAFQSTNSVVFLESQQGNTAAGFLVTLKEKLASLQLEYGLLQKLTLDQDIQRRQEEASGNLTETNAVAAPPGMESLDVEYSKAKQQIALLGAMKEEWGRDLRPKHPKMMALSQQIEQWQRLLGVFRRNSQDQLESRKQSLAVQISETEKMITEQEAKALEVSRASAEFDRLKANQQRNQTMYERLLATMQTLNVNKEISPESVTIMENASSPKPARAQLAQMVAIGGIVGFAMAVGLLLVLDRLDDRMGSFSELREVFDEELLAQIPREKVRNGSDAVALVQPEDDRHAFVEAYRNLRSSFLFMSNSGERPRTVLLTSSVPNEGKSLTSANLAITLARSGSRVLIVDADLRKGALHRRFEIPCEAGFCEVLSNAMKWPDAVISTKEPNLFLLPRGATSSRSSELFLGAAMDEFLKEASAKFDFVILDTAPVMAADDVTSLAPKVDGVAFVIRADHTSARVARAALESLYQRQVDVLGIIFNAVPPTSVDYYYYYKYKDYYTTYPSSDARGKRRSPVETESA